MGLVLYLGKNNTNHQNKSESLLCDGFVVEWRTECFGATPQLLVPRMRVVVVIGHGGHLWREVFAILVEVPILPPSDIWVVGVGETDR